MTTPPDEFSLPDIDLPFDVTPDLDSFWQDMALDEPDAAELWELTQDEADRQLNLPVLVERLHEPAGLVCAARTWLQSLCALCR